ncbi:MAG TPA: nucleotidyltransferase domain-containing protein [Actinomycetes bacterium]|nr:nucleotidyltransferase domain-containing protein [Actinomycetes bacterium]
MDPLDIATQMTGTRFPSLVGAWLSGSSATDRATSTSDVDVVVVASNVQSFRETSERGGRLVELFVHTEASLAEWYASEASDHRCTLAHMIATGRLVAGGARAERLQVAARRHVDAGPPARTTEEVAALRYHLSAALDDLVESADDERVFVAHDVVALTSDLELALAQAWTGRGRWRYRWLADISPEVARGLAEGLGALRTDPQQLIDVASDVLERSGGRLQAGYRLG